MRKILAASSLLCASLIAGCGTSADQSDALLTAIKGEWGWNEGLPGGPVAGMDSRELWCFSQDGRFSRRIFRSNSTIVGKYEIAGNRLKVKAVGIEVIQEYEISMPNNDELELKELREKSPETYKLKRPQGGGGRGKQ